MKHLILTIIVAVLLVGCGKPKNQTASKANDASEKHDASEKQIVKIVYILKRNTDLEHRFSVRMKTEDDYNREEGRLKDFAEERKNEINEIIMDLEQNNYPKYFELKNLIASYFRVNDVKVMYSKYSTRSISLFGKRDLDHEAQQHASTSTMGDIEDFVSEINKLSKEELEKRLSFLRKRSYYESWTMLYSERSPYGMQKTSVGKNQNQPTLQVEDIDQIIEKANNGNPRAQAQLGGMYFDGNQVLKDDKKAAQWFLRSAQQDNGMGQFQTGILYLISNEKRVQRGLKRNPAYDIEGYKWLYLATQKGHKMDQSIKEIINLHLTQRQISEGRKRASKFTPKKE